MPTSPNTNAIAKAIQSIMLSAQVGGQPVYANVIIGGLKDYTDALPVGVIIAEAGSSERYTLGRNAKIKDKPRFSISTAVSYIDAAAAESQLLAIRDAVVFLFMQSATLNTPGVTLSRPVPDSERYDFASINGSPLRTHEFALEVIYEYTLPLGPQP